MPPTKRICILGATCPIGINLTEALCLSGYELNISYKSTKLLPANWSANKRLHPCHAHLRDVASLLAACQGCDTVVWLIHAWQNHPDHGEDSLNTTALHSFCREIGQTDIQQIVFLSSGGSIYGESLFLPVTEEHPLNAVSSYGQTKKRMESILLECSHRTQVRAAILRPSNVYGTSTLLTREHGIIGSYFRSIKEGKPFPLVAQGKQVRDYVHVCDVVKAIEHAIHATEATLVWNVGTNTGKSVLEIVTLIQAIMPGKHPEIVDLPERVGDVSVNILSTEKIRGMTGWEPRVSLNEGLKLAAEMLRN